MQFVAVAAACLGWPAAPADPVTPAAAVRTALADCRRLDPVTALSVRYFSAGHLPAAEWPAVYAVLSYHVNGLSREGTVARPRRVNGWLWAVDLRDYKWDRLRYGKLVFGKGAVEPYFHVRLEGVEKGGKVPAHAPWLPAAEVAELARLTDSSVPLVRADWFLHRTAIQEGRDDFGYLDFLELRSRADAEKLAGLDRAKATELFREQAAVIADSGVALQSRQLFRYATISGAWWESRDTKNEENGAAERNAVRLLLEDYRHDAEEIVFTLPNGLPGYYLSDAKGVGVKSAPPDIASDALSGSNDRRVHVGLSCVRCHQAGGLKPFDDYARSLYAKGSGVALGATDDAKYRRLKSVYLGPVERAFKRDVDDFSAAVNEACGMKPAELAKAYGAAWSRYADQRVTLDRAAAECGLAPAEFKARLTRYAESAKLIDPVLAGYLAADKAARREHFEEVFPLLMSVLGNPGAQP